MGSKKEIKKPKKEANELIITEKTAELSEEEREQRLRQAIAILIEMYNM